MEEKKKLIEELKRRYELIWMEKIKNIERWEKHWASVRREQEKRIDFLQGVALGLIYGIIGGLGSALVSNI